MSLTRPSLGDARRVLREKFGFSEFLPGQVEALEAVLAGRDVLAVMPTGSGKSLLYQLPAMLRIGLVVVVSPLIALMREQCQRPSPELAKPLLQQINRPKTQAFNTGEHCRGSLATAQIDGNSVGIDAAPSREIPTCR